MLVCFDKRGVLKEQLDGYGNPARVGSQNFKIFAYFKNIDIDNYGSAYIKLQRPDLEDSEYPILFMTQGDLTYNPSLILPRVSENFTAGEGPNEDGTYPGYLFDFGSIINTGDASDPSDDHIVSLLDTPGQWIATITLISTVTGASNVVGTISFNVEGPASNEEETDIGFDVVVHNMAVAIATKLNANSTYYVRSMDNFAYAAAESHGTLPKSIFSQPNITVWDRTTKAFYRITELHEKDDDHYWATYTKLVDLDDKLDIVSAIVVVEGPLTFSIVMNYQEGQLFYSIADGEFYRKVTSGYFEKAENVGILGSKNTLTRYVISATTKVSALSALTNGYQRNIIVNFLNKDYLLNVSEQISTYTVTMVDVYQQCLYVKSGISDLSTTQIADLIVAANKIEFVIRKSDPNTLYGIDSDGNQVNIAISDLLDGYIKYYQVPDYQANVSVIADILTNINGWVLTNFNYTTVTIAGYPAYKITTSGGDTLTEEQARTYMKAMTGSEYLPEYDFNRPQNSFMMLPDGTILKPQWDNSNGLLLYKMKRFADTDYVNNNILTLSSPGGILTDEQYSYVLTKNARIFYSTTGVFYEKYSEDSSQILFKAINSGVQNVGGVLTINNTDALSVTKSNKRYAFGVGSTQQTYGKGKLDADFATKNYVDESIQEVKQNSLQNVDTDEYPTLQDFLDSEGEEGYIYLYPIDLSDLTKGYYRYIWEYIPADDAYEWEYLGTTEIDLSDFEVTFEQKTFGNGVVSVEFKNNTDYQLISLVDTVSVALVIPSEIFQGWIGSCTFTVGNTIPSFTLTNNSSYNVVFIVNNRKADVSGIALNLDTNGIVECLAECNGFDIRVYMKEVTN